MHDNEFRVWSHKAADWGVDYFRVSHGLHRIRDEEERRSFGAPLPCSSPFAQRSLDLHQALSRCLVKAFGGVGTQSGRTGHVGRLL